MYELCNAIIGALVEPRVCELLADLAGVDQVLVPPPAALDFVSSVDIGQLLDGTSLTPIPDAGMSRGANLVANPSLDLHDPDERSTQVDRWLRQIALDAGLRGMDRVLERLHSSAAN